MNDELIEYRVKTVERYIVTRYEKQGDETAVVERGNFASPHIAYEVAYALARADHERKGWPPFDVRIQYPRHPIEPEAPASTNGELRD
jgi:hypothetical protein